MPKVVKLTNGYYKEVLDNGTTYFHPNTYPSDDKIAAGTYYTRIKEGTIQKGKTIVDDIPPGFAVEFLPQNTNDNVQQQSTTSTPPITDFSLPDAKSNASRPTSGAKATPKELSQGIQTGLIVVTSLASMFTSIPELAMQEMEAKAIAIPVGNLLEHTEINKKYGRAIANSGDVQLLTYASGQYMFRSGAAISKKIRDRKNNGYTQSHGNNVSPGVSDNGEETRSQNGVFYRPAPSGLRAFTRTS